jgi:16S rRNA A1518/A1519 N6-dimethyltransferase RsmA/KsgA/DIM1 with predicted DNA glycosylase/AP lyase activity
LTQRLLATGAEVIAIELDGDIHAHLLDTFSGFESASRLNLICGDVLDQRWPPDLTHIVSNPPYQISSPLLERISDHQRRYGKLRAVVLLLQEEFATRLLMDQGPASRGSLGICTSFEWYVEKGVKVPAHMFKPQPDVHSRLVRLLPRQRYEEKGGQTPPSAEPNFGDSGNIALARHIVRHCFSERRKKLRNTLSKAPRRISRLSGWHRQRWQASIGALFALQQEEELDSLPSSWPNMRPEELSSDDWLILADKLQQFHSFDQSG